MHQIRIGQADLDAVHRMLAGSYWSPRIRKDVVVRTFANSPHAGAFDPDGRQIGVVRVVTDFATFAWLCDVYVDESHRGRGIGKQMVEALLALPELATVRRWVLATRDAHELYRAYDFAEVDPGRWMERRSPPAAWQE